MYEFQTQKINFAALACILVFRFILASLYRYDSGTPPCQELAGLQQQSGQIQNRIPTTECTIYRHEETGDRALQLFLSRSVRVSTLHTLLHRHIHKQVCIIILRILLYQKIVMKTLNFTFNATVEEGKRWSLYNILNC